MRECANVAAVGFSSTFVVAKWYRPLQELAVGARLYNTHPDPVSWSREDGWQCYAPESFYDGQFLPPVLDIAAETRGPVLGAGVDDSDTWAMSWIDEQAEMRSVKVGATDDEPSREVAARMRAQWGRPWHHSAYASLAQWGHTHTGADTGLGLWGAMVCSQLFAEKTVFDILALLGLTPDATPEPLWAGIPDCDYAVDARNVSDLLHQVSPGKGRSDEIDLVLACTKSGWAVWSARDRRMLADPDTSLASIIDKLADIARQRGWRDTPPLDWRW